MRTQRELGGSAPARMSVPDPGAHPSHRPAVSCPPRGVESDSLRLSALKLYLHRVRFCIGVLKRQDNPGIQTCDVLLLQRGREGV